MQSQITCRLQDDLDEEISSLAKKLHLKRSDIVRMALERFLKDTRTEDEKSPYEKVKSLIGSFSSGMDDLGESHRKYLLKMFRKHA